MLAQGQRQFVVKLDAKEDLDGIWCQLEEIGCEILYSDSNETSQQIFCRFPLNVDEQDVINQCPGVLAIHVAPPLEIDWEAQWAEHAQGYRNGYLYVDLQEITGCSSMLPELKLKPGPGFGDLSHPTTRLMLRLMPDVVQQGYVLDVGCGSGILSLAATAMGATSVCGIDIDDQALNHSRLNSRENGMSIPFMHTSEYEKTMTPGCPFVILMNMIQSEQCMVWEALASIHSMASCLISSGILEEDSADYIKLCQSWGWALVEQVEEEGWIGFRFIRT